VLAHWNNSSSVDMSLHSGHIQILSQPGFVLSLSPTHILLSLVWPDWGSKPRLTALDVSFLTIHSLMLVCLSVDKWTEAFIWYKYHTYILRKEIHFYRLTRLLALCFSSPGIMWGIVITYRPSSSSVNFYILIFFSETKGPVRTNFGKNVHWMLLLRS
jgi:hypothetical protein